MVEAPNKLLDRARAELHTFDRVGKQTASELILALFEAERQIAELRTKLDEYKEVAHDRTAAWTAAEAENARLRALPLKDEVERETVWLIERKDNAVFQKPHWYREEPSGWHWWTMDACEATRFATKTEAEASPAYRMIADDPSITLTEHVFLASLRTGEQEGWLLPEGTLAVHGKDVVIAYDDFRDARRAFNILENVIGAAPSEQGGDRP